MINLSSIGEFLEKRLGLDSGFLGEEATDRAVSCLMKDADCRDVREYFDLVNSSAHERERLFGMFLVHETWFFRDSEPFNVLRRYIREEWAPANQEAVLRVLSVPCSTGEEPYSIAMSLLEERLPPERFRIEAVDISNKVLETARKAVYGNGSFREGSFTPDGWFSPAEGGVRPNKPVRRAVRFHKADLLDPGFLKESAPFHVIFCRNLIVYLTGEARERAWANLDRLLAPDGLFFTGSAEVPFFCSRGLEPLKHLRSFALRRADRKARKPAVSGTKSFRKSRRTAHSYAHSERAVHRPLPAEAKPDESSAKAFRPPAGVSPEEIRSLADRGELRGALDRCGEVIAAGKANAEIFYLSGLIHEEMGQTEASEAHLLKAVYLDPRHHEALLHLSLLYHRKGDAVRAKLYRDRTQRTE